MIQINDSHDNGGQGKDALIGELSSKTSRRLLAECLANREEEGFYDPDFYDDDLDDLVAPRACGEPHPTITDGSYNYCTLPPGHAHHAHHVHQTARGAQWPRSAS